MVKGNQKNIWIIAFAVFISIFFSSISYASTYKWEDFTEPFKQKFELEEGQNITIEIDLPDFIIRNYKTVPLYVDYSISQSASNYPSIQINKSIWAMYNLTSSKLVNIKAKHLKVGINKIKFFLKRDISERYTSGEVNVNELRFDFAEIASLKAKFSTKDDLETKPAISDSNKLSDSKDVEENRQKHYGFQKLKTFNRSLDKKTRKYLQYALKHLGYYHGSVDGVLGPNTRKAIKAYQENEGKVATRYFDKETVKKLAQIGRAVSKNTKKKSVAKAKINKKTAKIEKKKSADPQLQNKTNSHLSSKKNIIADNRKETKPNNEIKPNLKKESRKQGDRKAKVNEHIDDVIIRTPEDLEKRYKSLIDSFNLSMNETFYNQMINAIKSCNRTGYYVSGVFISHYLYMRLNDLALKSQDSPDFQQNAKLAKQFKNTRNKMIRYYNGSTEDKQALKAILNQCVKYYQKTETRSLLGKK